MPRRRLPEKTRQEIFAHWIQTNNYAQTAKVFHVSDNTVKNVVQDMPEFYAREHEHQRLAFVREAWLLARKALREIDHKMADGDLRDVSVAFGIIAQRATHAMYAAQKARLPDVILNTPPALEYEVNADDLLIALNKARRQIANRNNGRLVEAEARIED